MSGTKGFEHLPLPILYEGKPKLSGRGTKTDQTTHNRMNRVAHGGYIKRRSVELSQFWKERRMNRIEHELPKIEVGIPILLEIDPNSNIDFLRGLGFEIVCEIGEGYIIVATEDLDFSTFHDKLDGFINNVSRNCNSPAKVYALCEDSDRLKKILTDDLYNKWATIKADNIYLIDIGVSCCGNIKLPDKPKRKKDESDTQYSIRENRWKTKFSEAYIQWDELKMEREDIIESFISIYNGYIESIADGDDGTTKLPDSFSARLRISGKCLTDLALNFSYIFEIAEAEVIEMAIGCTSTVNTSETLTLLEPLDEDPVICVIDSGIQEGHFYLSPAIISTDSYNLIPGKLNASDDVSNGGHGTRIAGALLYPDNIPKDGEYQLSSWIRNMRVLDENNSLPLELYPPKLISLAVENFNTKVQIPSKIFNHSIGARKACELKHMSAWAAEIDYQSYSNDILFIQAAGNIDIDLISSYYKNGYPYPNYFDKELCRISDPAQSLQALTVGSVSKTSFETDDMIGLGNKHEISSFSRSGPGIWDVIKPEVVEFGGTHVMIKGSNPPQLITPKEVCPELIRKSPEGPAYTQDAIGTSFAAPKVAHIAAQIQKMLPKSPALLYRALIVQSARWPKHAEDMSKEECISTLRRIGYGLPDLNRAIQNDEYRITLITPNTLELGVDEAHVFQIPIPEELSQIGDSYDILIQITLSYNASPRRTRRSLKGYLSTWLDWRCSRMGESASTFAERVFETGSSIDDDGNFNWVIGEARNRGMADNYSRSNSTVQKDWCVIKSNQLSDAFSIAVRGHKGWGALLKAKYSLVVSIEAINQDVPIYEPIKTQIELSIDTGEIQIEMPDN